MKRLFALVISLILCLSLSACSGSSSDKFNGGTFYLASDPLSSDGTPYVIATFRSDGTGSVNPDGGDYSFTWRETDGYIMLSIAPLLSSTTFQYQNGYLIAPSYIWDGKIPDSDTFNATVSLQNIGTISFEETGDVTYATVNGTERTYSYTRDGNIISYGSYSRTPSYLVSNGQLCTYFLAPYTED